ncbi:gliding motility-associated C-terminal domain-containing protein [Chitinophaga sp. CF118]|uniref:T9SS type B sorting domain-containing protein n=1 Tax=Chitinophaga sp. CF118 TaxID=1884367 RepID=UPI0015A6C873|nr:gliding motility-associated C-terminal domain-containing protein [Chitinophaga sp. CF118]
MRTISYNSIRLTLLDFKQRRVALVHGTKMLILLLLTGFSWQPAAAGSAKSTRDGISPAHIVKSRAFTSTQWIDALQITPSGANGASAAGDLIRYTIHVRNDDAAPLTTITVKDSLPANTTWTSGGSYDITNKIITFTNSAPLAAGVTTTFSFLVQVNGPVPPTVGYIRHTGYVDIGDGIWQPTASSSTAPADPSVYATNVPVDNGLNSVSWKEQRYKPSGSNGYIQSSDIITYVIHVRNNGTLPLTNIRVTDYIPSYTNWESEPNNVKPDVNGMMSWIIPSLTVGQEDSVKFNVRVAADLTGANTIENTAYVNNMNGKDSIPTFPADATGKNPNTTPTTGPSTSIPIKAVKSFETWKVVMNATDNNATTVGPGEDLFYTIFVRNTGNVGITKITIDDAIPDGTTFKSLGVGEGGQWTPFPSSIHWEINNIAATATATVHYTVTVNEHLEGFKNIKGTANVSNGDTIIHTLGCDPTVAGCDASKYETSIPIAGTRADLFISNVVTPNGDGKNDAFVVRLIENYPGSALYIYNRWGNEVYQNKNYQNNWSAAGLSEGTYYYRFELKDAAGKIKLYKGWVMIIR